MLTLHLALRPYLALVLNVMAWLHCVKIDELQSINSGVHPLIHQQFGYVRLTAPLLDLGGISTEFCGAISTQFCFSCLLRGITAMPRGLHASLCHSFLVS